MLQVSKLLPQGQGLAPVLLKRATTVELGWDVRQKSRFAATDSAGRELGIFLPRGTLVRGGDVLVAEDGSMVRVIAAPQPVLVSTHLPARTARPSTCCVRPITSATAMCSSSCSPITSSSNRIMCWPTCCARCT